MRPRGIIGVIEGSLVLSRCLSRCIRPNLINILEVILRIIALGSNWFTKSYR